MEFAKLMLQLSRQSHFLQRFVTYSPNSSVALWRIATSCSTVIAGSKTTAEPVVSDNNCRYSDIGDKPTEARNESSKSGLSTGHR